MLNNKKILGFGFSSLLVLVASLFWWAYAAEPLAIVIKYNPVNVQVTSSPSLPAAAQEEEARTAQLLFDRDTTTEHVAFEASQFITQLETLTAVTHIKVYGAAPYTLSVEAEIAGSFQPIPELQNINLALLPEAWIPLPVSTVDPTVTVPTTKLRFSLVPVTGSTATGLKEIEVWGAGYAVNSKDGADLLAKLTAGLVLPHVKILPAVNATTTPTEGSIGPLTGDLPDDPADNSFTFNLTTNPSQAVRAYLTYETVGINHWVEAVRSINGVSPQSGLITQSGTDWSTQVERIKPESLLLGENTLTFAVPQGVTSPYTVRNIRVLLERENGANVIDEIISNQPDLAGDNPLTNLYDGDPNTGWKPFPPNQPVNAVAPEAEFILNKTYQLSAVALKLSGVLEGTLSLDVKKNGVWTSIKTLSGVIDPANFVATDGWITYFAEGNFTPDELTIEAFRLSFSNGVETDSAVLEAVLLGSGVGPAYNPPLVKVSYPANGEFYGRDAYVRGFIEPVDNGSGAAQIFMAGLPVAHTNGNFDHWINKNDAGLAEQGDEEAWSVDVVATYPDGANITRTINFDAQQFTIAPVDGIIVGEKAELVSATETVDHTIVHDEAQLDVTTGALDTDTTITVKPLKDTEMPALDAGMTNVTKGPRRGYRFLPHGSKFKKKLKVKLKYNKALVPAGSTEQDIKTFYFDEEAGVWKELERVLVDTTTKTVESLTDHFTDMINAVVTVPDSPEAASFNPTSMKDIKAADPGANVNLIEAPEVNNSGDASVSYPIEVPAGRQGIQPQLAVQYNSSGGNGWMGLGWDIATQAISIDTRWGVPRYDTGEIENGVAKETETYTLSGGQLTPVAHRGALRNRADDVQIINGKSAKIFHTRVEGGFNKIIRYGTGPSDYIWEVIDKNGTIYSYGGGADTSYLPSSQSTLTDDAGNIFKWALHRVDDLNGNYMVYNYLHQSDTGFGDGVKSAGENAVLGSQLYLDTISYTGNSNTNATPYYSVKFIRDRQLPGYDPVLDRRKDISIDGRGGFKMVTADVLKAVEVYSGTNRIRSYKFDYQYGAFNKKLLLSVSQHGKEDIFFNKHNFSYYNEVGSGTAYTGFGTTKSWTTTDDDIGKRFPSESLSVHNAEATAISGSYGKSTSNDRFEGWSLIGVKHLSFGRKKGSSNGSSEAIVAMVDLDGDGLPDKVFDCSLARQSATKTACAGSRYAYRPNPASPTADLSTIVYNRLIPLPTLPAISRESTSSSFRGIEGYYMGASALTNSSRSTNTQTAYFTDVNGDGLVDVVSGNKVYFNFIGINGVPVKPGETGGIPTFTENSNLTPAPIQLASVDSTGTIPDFSSYKRELVADNPLVDAVRRWKAPFTGNVKISGDYSLVAPANPENTSIPRDGVRLAIQHNTAAAESEVWSTEIVAGDHTIYTPTVPVITVTKGDRLYFRVASQYDGNDDNVTWAPEVVYVDALETPLVAQDVNGLNIYTYHSGNDLVYAGRTMPIRVPFTGKIRLDGVAEKLAVTTDDVRFAVYKLTQTELSALGDPAKVAAVHTPVLSKTLKWDAIDSVTFTAGADDIAVNKDEYIIILMSADSNVDLKQLRFNPKAYYVEAFTPDQVPLDDSGTPLPPQEDGDGNIIPWPVAGAPIDLAIAPIELNATYDIEFYSNNKLDGPQQTWTAPQTGKILISPKVNAPLVNGEPVFSENTEVVYTVKKQNALLGKKVIKIVANQPFEAYKNSFEISVTQGDELYFDFSSRDVYFENKVASVEASLHYVATPTSLTVPAYYSTSGKQTEATYNASAGIVTIKPVINLPTGTFTADSSIDLIVSRDYDDGSNKGATSVFTRTVKLVAGTTGIAPTDYAFDIGVATGDTLRLKYVTTDVSLEALGMTTSVQLSVTDNADIVAAPATLHQNSVAQAFPRPYRGWAYLGYAINDSCAQKRALGDITETAPCTEPLIDESLLVVSSTEADYNPLNPDGSRKDIDASANDSKFYIANPDVANQRWFVIDDDWAITNLSMQASRLGRNTITVLEASSLQGASAVPKVSTTKQNALGVGWYISINDGSAPTNSVLDFMDMNGDRYPDVVSQNRVQYSLPNGSLEAKGRTPAGHGGIRVSNNDFLRLSGGGTIPLDSGSAENEQENESTVNSGGDTKPPHQSPSLGFSGGFGTGKNEVVQDLMDINGDGLPDRIYQSATGHWLQLNLGYKFAAIEPWVPTMPTSKGESKNYSLGISLGYSDGVRGFTGGYSVAVSKNFSTDRTFNDINGDGLIDIITVANGQLMVSLNNGGNFENAVAWSAERSLGVNRSFTSSKGLSIVSPVGPLCIFTPFCFNMYNPSRSWDDSLSYSENAFRDVNGDGFVDYVSSGNDGQMSVAFNNTGRSNLLKSIERPLGATINIEYQRDGNRYELPQSRWLMSATTIDDAHAGDGVNYLVKSYQYGNGNYNRNEREFYGYANVSVTDRNSSNLTAATLEKADKAGLGAYRREVNTYLNDSYYRKGLVESSLIEDVSSATPQPYSKTVNTYFLRNVLSGTELLDGSSTTATVFPQLTQTDKYVYEAASLDVAGQHTYTTYGYDDYGNVDTYADYANATDTTDDVFAKIDYSHVDAICKDKHIVGKAKLITVTASPGITTPWLRKRQADFDCATTGNLKELREYNTETEIAVTSLSYENDGNLDTITRPNINTPTGARHVRRYDYDSTVAIYPEKIEASYNATSYYTSTALYDYDFGEPLFVKDINANETIYAYDNFGRLTSVTGPYDHGPSLRGQASTTLSFDYPLAIDTLDAANGVTALTAPHHAVTHHIDKDADDASRNTIDTVLFIDGLKRVLQTKKDVDVFNGNDRSGSMTVSGCQVYDAYGRIEESYYPIYETKGSDATFNVLCDTTSRASSSIYDVLDRAKQLNIPATATSDFITKIEFAFGANATHMTRVIRVMDARTNKKETYRDPRGLITLLKEFNPIGQQPEISTRYEYDILKQISKVIDAQGNTTVVEYDKLGRRELIDNPDTGLTTYGYDLASNLISKQTANLKTESRFISYVYDYGRLTEINYNGTLGTPRDVTYTYGAPNAANNQAGRVISMTHQAGSDTRLYGALGEITSETRSVTTLQTPQTPELYTTSYKYDSFGRLLRLTYPDAEVLTNTYDSGGNLASVKGNKNGYKYKYINDLYYDHFEQRVRVEAANRVNTSYGYDTYNRRLERLVVEKNGQENLIDLDYTYDEVGNIIKLDNVLTGTISNQFGRLDVQNFEYDDLNRLTHGDGLFNLPQGQGKTRAYSMDMKYSTVHNIVSKIQVDNITQSSGTLIPQKKTSYTWKYRYPAATTARPHAPQQIGVANTAGVITGRTFSYDLNGNQTGWTHDSNGTRRTIAWDEENRIQSIADNGHVKDYTYDAAGQRVSKRGPQGETVYVNQFFTMRNSTQGTKHVYAGTQRMVSKLMKQDGPGANPKGKTPYEKDQYYYHPDHLGSSSLVTDAGGKIYQHLAYFPFGETWVEETSNTQRTPYWFTAKELDEETGLYYFGARYYDPRTSVWQSVDPVLDEYLPNMLAIEERFRESGQKLAQWNPWKELLGNGGVFESTNLGLYGYVGQNPIMYKDPDGRSKKSDAIKAIWDAIFGKSKPKPKPDVKPDIKPKPSDVTRREKKGVSNPDIPKIPVPKVPPGMTQSVFGKKVIGWGSGPKGALDQLKNITKASVSKMKKQGLTKDMAVEWKKFYQNDLKRNANNITAKNRIKLMKKIIKNF